MDFGCGVSIAVTVLGLHGAVWEGQGLAQICLKLLPKLLCVLLGQPPSPATIPLLCSEFSPSFTPRSVAPDIWEMGMLIGAVAAAAHFSPTPSSVPAVVGLPACTPWQPC